MKLYRTNANRWAGTQADAGKKGTWEEIDVPTSKADLIAFLNDMEERAEQVQFSDGAGLQEPGDRFPHEIAVERATPRINLAPLRYGTGWRAIPSVIAEAVAEMDMNAAVRWAEAAIGRIVELQSPTAVEEADDSADDLI